MLLVVEHRHRLPGLAGPGSHEGGDRPLTITDQGVLTRRSADPRLDPVMPVAAQPIPQEPVRCLITHEVLTEQALDALPVDHPAAALTLPLNHLGQFDLQPAGQGEPAVALHHEGHSALAGLTVDPHHLLVGATQVPRIDGQIGDLPGGIRTLALQGLADGILVAARKGRVDQLAHPGVPGVGFDAGALPHHGQDLVRVAEIEPGVDPLTVEVHGQRHQVHIAGTLAVAQ